MAWLYLQNPQAGWGAATLWLRLAFADDSERHVAHMLEHILLRRLRANDSPFVSHAATGDDWTFFRVAFLAETLPKDRYREALALLNIVLAPWQASDNEIELALCEIYHELRAPTSFHALTVAVRQTSLANFHRRFFTSGNALLSVMSPATEGMARHEAETAFASLTPVRRQTTGEFAEHSGQVMHHAAWETFDIVLAGPPLAAGELAYARLFPAYLGYLMAMQGEQWEGAWWHSVGSSGFGFTRLKAPTYTGSFEPAWEKATTELAADALFDRLREHLRQAFYQPSGSVLAHSETLGKAWAGGYLADLLHYPELLAATTPQDFHAWCRAYRAHSHLYICTPRVAHKRPGPDTMRLTDSVAVPKGGEMTGETMSVWLAEQVYQEIIGRGLAYHTGVSYHREQKRLEVWVEISFWEKEEVEDKVSLAMEKLLKSMPDAIANEEIWHRLEEKARLWRRMETGQ
jgi:hypothetical protein